VRARIRARLPHRLVLSLAPLAALLAALVGCGYGLRGNLPDHIRTVAVPIFANRTTEPAVESFLTRAVVEAFTTNGRLRVVRPEEADAILDGEVTGYTLQAIAFDPRANIREYRLIVTMNLRLRDVRRNEVLFQQAGLQERADFRVLGATAETITREESALRAAAVDIARTVVTLAVERF
jgi:outer membrane lipopolysaccharide assembly protein LptE/RlpB